jgi:hypothetical protein
MPRDRQHYRNYLLEHLQSIELAANTELLFLFDHLTLPESENTLGPEWDRLLNELLAVPPGRNDAAGYENAVESLMTALFYPSLTNPRVQTEIHEGRKRIDITYTNAASSGFFYWLSLHYESAHIFVECKNYTGDPGNPEVDQLSGRFSPARGRVGILVCRTFQDKELFLQRCRDTVNDDRGFVIALDDEDLAALIEEQRRSGGQHEFTLLRQRFGRLLF